MQYRAGLLVLEGFAMKKAQPIDCNMNRKGNNRRTIFIAAITRLILDFRNIMSHLKWDEIFKIRSRMKD